MTAKAPRLLLVLLLTLGIQGCSLIGGIFKAGFVSAIAVIVLLVLVIWFFARKLGGRPPS